MNVTAGVPQGSRLGPLLFIIYINDIINDIQSEIMIFADGLVAKLSQIGIDGNFLDFFKSYLRNRKQCVIIDGVKSNFLDVTAGVPQGSRLGPLLFIIYINDIINDIQSDIMIFADDTTLLASGDDPTITASQLNF